MALSERPTALAWAWVVAGAQRVFSGDPLHDPSGGLPVLNEPGHDGHGEPDVIEEQIQTFTQVIMVWLALAREPESILGAASMAQHPHAARLALPSQTVALAVAECSLSSRRDHLEHLGLVDIAELVFRLDEVIAGIKIAVVLERRPIPTRRRVDAQEVLAEECVQRHVEQPTTGRPLAKIAAQVMAGQTLAQLGVTDGVRLGHVAVKESVFPFAKFPGVDTQLGPEMRSTGEVMGIATSFAHAFGKALRGSGTKLPTGGCVFISVKDDDKPGACVVARRLHALGFTIMATTGTADAFERARIPTTRIRKVAEGSPHVVDAIKAEEVALVVNTTVGARSIRDSYAIRRNALLANVPYFTTIAAAMAVTEVLEANATDPQATYGVKSLQEWNGLSGTTA